MPTNILALKAICESLIRFFEEFAKEDKPERPISLPHPEWRFYDAGIMLIYRRPETMEALTSFQKRFRRKEWTTRWSSDFVRGAERDVVTAGSGSCSEDKIMAALTHVAERLDAEPPEYVVVLPLARVYLGNFTMVFPDIEVQTITAERLTSIRESIYTIVGTTPHTDEEKQSINASADETTEMLLNRPAAFVTVRGDVPLAKQRAIKKAETVVDLIQAAAAMNHPYGEVNIAFGGDLLSRQPPVLFIAKDGTNIHYEGRPAYDIRYEIEAEHIEKMRGNGFGPLLDAIGKPENDRTEFEEILIRSLHWFAEAERQTTIENKSTAYVTSIDMFFATKNEPLTRDVTEGTAMVLGSTLEARRELVKIMDRFYDLRSRVSHAGVEVDEGEIAGLQVHALSFLAKMSSMASEFSTKEQFRAWIREQRLSPLRRSCRP